jgi:NosR/NirI family nitrous oxide reductase transcriptional regulator
MRTIRRAILITTILSLLLGYGIRIYRAAPTIDERVYLKEIAPEVHFLEKQGNPPVYLADNGMIAFNSRDVTPSIRGYAGPITLMLAMDRTGRITGLKIIEHRETRNYVHYMELPAYLAQFIGKVVTDPFVVDQDIDGISRATVSVKALASTVRESSRIIAMNMLGMHITAGRDSSKREYTWLWYAILFFLAFSGYLLTRKYRNHLRVRDISLLAGIIVIGFSLSCPVSILHIFNLILLRPSSSALWYVIVISTLASVVIAGRFYCGWLCPFGALSEFIGRLPFKKWIIPNELDDRGRNLKYVFLGLIIVLVFVSCRVDYGNYETYVTLFSLHGNILTWSLVAIALLANLRIERFWCRYLCPMAALMGIFSRRTKGYPSMHDCPMGNKQLPLVSECIRCNRCYHRSKEAGQI